jgi:hypothetical protein
MKTHDVRVLWRSAREVIEREWPDGDKEVLQTVEKQLDELASLDPGSFAFRYPVDSDGDPNFPRHGMLNLRNFADVAGRLSRFLETCAEGLWCKLGDKAGDGREPKADRLAEIEKYIGWGDLPGN